MVIERDSRNLKRAAEASRQANERFRRFVDSNIIGVVVATPSGSLIEANDYYLRLVGYTREEFDIGLVDWRAITPPEWIPADERWIGELRQSGKSASYERNTSQGDGTRVTVLLSDAMLPGNEEHIAAFVLDITERKKAEEALRESEERFRIMADGCPTIIWVQTQKVGTGSSTARTASSSASPTSKRKETSGSRSFTPTISGVPGSIPPRSRGASAFPG